MIDIQQLTSLISAFRVETEKESISPETVGSILQAIADLLATATSETEYNIIRFWKETLQQFRFLYDIQQRNVDDHSNVILQLMARSMVDGATSSLTLAIGPATRTRAGVLTAEDYIRIQGIGETNDELTDTVLEMQDIIDQHTARLNAIGAAGNVLQFFAEGNSDANKVVFSASRYNLFNGAGTMATAALVINGATDQKAGAMTAAHVISLNAAKTDITALKAAMQKVQGSGALVDDIRQHYTAADRIGFEIIGYNVATGEQNIVLKRLFLTGADTQNAGLMTSAMVTQLNQLRQAVFGSGGSTAQSTTFFNIGIEINKGTGALHLRGAEELIAKGYTPYLFRYTRKRNRVNISGEDGDGHRGTLRFGDDMKVSAGQNSGSTSAFTSDQRVPACWFRPFARIEPCDHAGATYTIASDTHTMHCRYCTYSPTEEHTFVDGICTVCGASGSTCTISIYLPEAIDGHYTDGHYASEPRVQQFATGTVISLPAPPVSYLPNGVTFAGWAVGTPTELGITSYWKADDETVLEAGSEYTISADVSLTARYMGVNVILADDADNSDILYQNKGKKAQSVTLMGRTLHKDGSWNTLFLPFSLTAEQIAESPLAGAVLMTLDESEFNEVTRELTIRFAPAVSLEAGKPYIVKWTEGTDIENPVFNNVTINNSIANTSTIYVDFTGTYSPEVIYKEDNVKNILYLDGNVLRFPTGEQAQVNACRAYFELRNMVMPGDMDEDSHITITDVTILINILLDEVEENVAADVNCDGQTNISDVTKLINVLLGAASISPVTHIETNVGITME